MFSLIKEHSRRHTVYVISFYGNDDIPHIGRLERYCEEVIPVLRFNNIVTEWPSLVPFIILAQFEHREMHEKIAAFMASHRVDIVTVEYMAMARYLPPECRSVLVVHEMMSLSAMRELKHRSLSGKIQLLLTLLKTLVFEAKIFKRYDYLVALTERERKLINFISPSSRLRVVPSGADSRYFYPQPGVEETFDFVFMGNFYHKPNRDAMDYFCSQIFPLIKRDIPDARLTIVGYKSDEFLGSLKFCGGVTIAGWVEDTRPYLACAKVFINPIRLGGGIRNKVLEVFAMAKPVISTSIGADGLEARDGENIIIADTPADFARRAVDLLKSKDMRGKIGARAYELFKEKYDWSRAVERMEKLYGEIDSEKAG